MRQIENPALFNKLNLETAKIPWRELQRFYAQGKVLYAHEDEDLVLIAEAIANNNTQRVEQLISMKKINLVSDELARQWLEGEHTVWAVVIAPWVLVQPAAGD